MARLEINLILEELKKKQARAKFIRGILASKGKLWGVIREELVALGGKFGDKRRSKLGGVGAEEIQFDAQDFIVDEAFTVVVTYDGWLKRVREVKDLSTTRVKEGDTILTAIRGSTRDPIAFFTNLGTCYVMLVNDIPATTGYGEPIQKFFKMKDGERLVAALHMTDKAVPKDAIALTISQNGYGCQFGLETHRETSTRTGRRFAKLAEGDRIVGVRMVHEGDIVGMITRDARAVLCDVDEAPELTNPGRGVIMIKVEPSDAVLGFGLSHDNARATVYAETHSGRRLVFGPNGHQITGRGGKGHALAKRSKVARVYTPEDESTGLLPPVDKAN